MASLLCNVIGFLQEYYDKDVQLLDDIKKVETTTSSREKKWVKFSHTWGS